MWFITLIVFIFILGIIVLIHELGHFFWAKKFGTHIYEFSIGMGPVIYSHIGKDKINYNIRALPIGGFVAMAGEVYEDGEEKLKKDKYLCNKPVWQRIIVMAAGVFNNFLLAIIILLCMSFIWGSHSLDPYIHSVEESSSLYIAGVKEGDLITHINGKKVNTCEEAILFLYYNDVKDYKEIKVIHKDGTKATLKAKAKVNEDKKKDMASYIEGVQFEKRGTTGFINKIKYSFSEFFNIVRTMWLSLAGLVTGKISIDALSGPVGMYEVVGTAVNYGIKNIIYMLAYLSINVGVVNIIPFPAFDGGRIFFLIIEKIKGSPVNQKFENACHTVGFILLMILVVLITIKDIINLF